MLLQSVLWTFAAGQIYINRIHERKEIENFRKIQNRSCGKIYSKNINPNSVHSRRRRTINGLNSASVDVPYIGSLRRISDEIDHRKIEDSLVGAVSLISSCYAITAAHLFKPGGICNEGSCVIDFGIDQIKRQSYYGLRTDFISTKDRFRQTMKIQKIIFHQDFQSLLYHTFNSQYLIPSADYALIQFYPVNPSGRSKCVQFNRMVQPICVNRDQVAAEVSNAKVSGYANADGHRLSRNQKIIHRRKRLRSSLTSVVDLQICKQDLYPDLVNLSSFYLESKYFLCAKDVKCNIQSKPDSAATPAQEIQADR